MARVIADSVVVREAPGRQSAFVMAFCFDVPTPCPPILFGRDSGIVNVYLLDGPVAADGYDWYLASSDSGSPFPENVGWIPAGDAAGPWVIGNPPECPAEPIQLDDVTLAAITPLARLDCLGDTELTLRGWYPPPPPGGEPSSEGCQPLDGRPGVCWFGYDMLRPVEAPWAGDANHLQWIVDSAAGLTQPERSTWITVRGQFDHPASSQCHGGDVQAVLWCRLDFVVTGLVSQ